MRADITRAWALIDHLALVRREPSLALRVQHLTLRGLPLLLTQPSKESQNKEILKSLSSPTGLRRASQFNLLDITLMGNLTSLTIEGSFDTTPSPSFALPSSLRTFVLRVPASSCAFLTSVLSFSDMTVIVPLREVSLEITCECDSHCSCLIAPPDMLGHRLLPFLRTSSSTLESLKLRLCLAVECMISATRFFDSLQATFPRLATLSILLSSFSPAVDEASLLASESIRRFITGSIPNIDCLALDMYPPLLLTYALPSSSSDNPEPNPQLQQLSLYLPERRRVAEHTQLTPFSLGQLSSYIGAQLPTLVVLDLGNISFRDHQLKEIVGMFRTGLAPLATLRFTIWRLQPQALVWISICLPRLKTLAITYESAQSDDCVNPYSDVWARMNAVRDML